MKLLIPTMLRFFVELDEEQLFNFLPFEMQKVKKYLQKICVP